ncbi:MAG: glycerol-3-phosphate acyltransferase [Oscillospiraceae bacterium]|nr:glycerol-3-phosphate acyltransferase [Oscillospiraceae bacterium]
MLLGMISETAETPDGWLLVLAFAICAVISYFLGCMNGAVIISKYILRNDVRGHGSGNAGLTNFYRTFGGPLTIGVILTDVLKAVAAVLLGLLIFGQFGVGIGVLGKYWCGMFCLIGHIFPCMFSFKGGKGILSGGTVALMMDWRVALVVWGGFLILTLVTRWVSLGSIWAAVSFPFATAFVFQSVSITILAAITGGLVAWKHHANVKRLLAGEEPKLSFRRKQNKGGSSS